MKLAGPLDERVELVRGEGLVAGRRRERQDAVAGQDDDRHAAQLRVVRHRACKLEAVHARHADVGEHDAGDVALAQVGERVEPILGERPPDGPVSASTSVKSSRTLRSSSTTSTECILATGPPRAAETECALHAPCPVPCPDGPGRPWYSDGDGSWAADRTTRLLT